MHSGIVRGTLALLGAIAVTVSGPARAEDAATPADIDGVNIKKVFAANCSWCHDGYGLHGGKGPALAGTALNAQQVSDRIKNGKSGLMPGFAKTLSEKEIAALTTYIMGLKPQ